VRRMSGLAAETFKLGGYGRVAVGSKANIVIFDPEKVIDQATFGDSKQFPLGIEYVLVEGEETVGRDEQRQEGAGKAVRMLTV